MENEKLQEWINNVQSKLGDDMSGLIADDLALLTTANMATNDLLTSKDTEILELKKTKETLLEVNGNLFKQVSMPAQPTQNDNKPTEEFSFSTIFDEKGNFKK